MPTVTNVTIVTSVTSVNDTTLLFSTLAPYVHYSQIASRDSENATKNEA